MWYEDLTTHYFGGENAKPLTAVGWLEKGKSFKKGKIQKEVYQKLCDLRENPWIFYVSLGFHDCDFCQNSQGTLNLTIPHHGKLYHYPELITHYIKEHSYQPPEEFCQAVLFCPPMRSMEYHKKMVKNGGGNLLKYFNEI